MHEGTFLVIHIKEMVTNIRIGPIASTNINNIDLHLVDNCPALIISYCFFSALVVCLPLLGSK